LAFRLLESAFERCSTCHDRVREVVRVGTQEVDSMGMSSVVLGDNMVLVLQTARSEQTRWRLATVIALHVVFICI
jgi:hypothetical protein